MNNKILRRSTYLFSSIAFVALLSSCHQKEEVKTVEKDPALPTFSLQKESLNTTLNMPGELTAYQQVDLYAKVASYVKTLKADIGSQVTKGQLLMTLEAPELNQQLAAADSRLKSQEAVYMSSKATYERMVETSKIPGTISKNDLDISAAKKNSDLAQLNALKAALKEAGNIQAYLEIRAPFSGIISARNVNLGAYVGPTGTGSALPLFTLVDQTHLRLAVSVPELYTGYLSKGDEISFTVNSMPDQKFTAKVVRLAGALDPRLRAERIEMDVANTNKKLLPNMVTDVTIPLPSDVKTFVVPKSAVVDGAEGVYVIRNNNNKAERVEVKTGREKDNKVEIFGDVKEGDQLVTSGSEEIRAGDPIKP